MRLRDCSPAIAVLLAIGCTTPAVEDTSGEGQPGKMMIRRGDGRLEDVTYIQHHGRAIWDHDIDLGPVPKPQQGSGGQTYALAIRGIDGRWPGGIVDWVWGDTFPVDQQVVIEDAMLDYEAMTPIKFHHGKEPGRPYLAIYLYYDDEGASKTTGIGPDGIDDDDETDVNFNSIGVDKVTVLHELGHAVGLGHEQRRWDRNGTVSYLSDCGSHEDQYDPYDPDDYMVFGDYDIHSIMQYQSEAFCDKAETWEIGTKHGHCYCYPLVMQGKPHNTDEGYIPRPSGFSAADLRALTRMYEPRLGSNEAGDLYGTATVAADFDGDGFDDLAIGAPEEARAGAPQGGAVFLYRGTEAGLVAWRVIAESDVTSDPHDGDQFGAVLAAKDFNKDGKSELIVGTPGRTIWGKSHAGSTYVFMGSRGGPVTDAGTFMEINQTGWGAGSSDNDDHFGSALAVGDLDGDGYADLAIGAPNEAPSGGVRSGYVNLFRWSTADGQLHTWAGHGIGEPITSSYTPAGGDGFGSALAISDFDDDGKKDLAIGAPAVGSGSRAGRVFLYLNNGSTLVYTQTVAESASGADAAAAGDEFGATLAVGNFDGAVYNFSTIEQHQLVVGAPGKDNPSNSGRVFVFGPRYDATAVIVTGLSQIKYFGQATIPGATNVAGDRFGEVFRAHDVTGDGKDDLIVGIPKKNSGSISNTGVVEIFAGSTSGLSGWNVLPQMTPVAGDHLGSSLGIGDFNNDGGVDIAAGRPGDHSDAGREDLYIGFPGGAALPPLWLGILDQEFHTPEH